jgi:chemotaxis protein CheX
MTYTISKDHLKHLLNALTSSLKHATNMPLVFDAPILGTPLDLQPQLGVLVEIHGELSGKLLINGSGELFQKISNAMWGMPLEGEMLQSFIGEVGNMTAGGAGVQLSGMGIKIDIEPPKLHIEAEELSKHQRCISVPARLDDSVFHLIFVFDNISS